MDSFLLGKIFVEKNSRWKYSGTAFFICENIAYTAYHCIENVDNYSNIYIEIGERKYTPTHISIIEELDFAKIVCNNSIEYNRFSKIVTESMINIKNLNCYGYKATVSESGSSEIRGIPLEIEKYIFENGEDEKADTCFIIKHEEDRAIWKGFSGAPVFDSRGIWGIVLRHLGGDGIKTRLKIISFNKIINYVVDNNKEDIMLDFPDEFTQSALHNRLNENSKKCMSLYHTDEYDYECKNINMITNFLRINDDVDAIKLSDEINNLIMPYALSLDKTFKESSYTSFDQMKEIMDRIDAVKLIMKDEYNSIYILLWMMTEGLTQYPRIANVLVENEEKYIEQDIYLKKENNKLIFLVPIVSVYEDIFSSIINIIEKISLQKEVGFFDPIDVDWDKKAIDCLDIKSKIRIGKLMRGENTDSINIDITALTLYSSKIYDEIPSIINTDDKFTKFFSKSFTKSFNKELQEYKDIISKLELINDININLFVLPVKDIQSIKNRTDRN
ncbi:hypothetical protein [Terrisporobacter petrolearius]|uniref:hypothetical protein n=1 Tax=Terrisporobacter petrolearius TaxID=1460447 RepID=UPI0031CC4D9B